MARDLSLGEAASAIGVSADTLRRWEKAGKLKTRRDERNRRRVPVAEVAAADRASRTPPHARLGLAAQPLRGHGALGRGGRRDGAGGVEAGPFAITAAITRDSVARARARARGAGDGVREGDLGDDRAARLMRRASRSVSCAAALACAGIAMGVAVAGAPARRARAAREQGHGVGDLRGLAGGLHGRPSRAGLSKGERLRLPRLRRGLERRRLGDQGRRSRR